MLLKNFYSFICIVFLLRQNDPVTGFDLNHPVKDFKAKGGGESFL